MKGAIDRYLDRVMAIADIRDSDQESRVREELRDHLEQKAESLKADGYDNAEALVKAIEDHGNPILIGYKLRPWRWLDVRLSGTARGVIAIGPKAHGVIAIGGLAVGVVACGGFAVGAFSFGGFALAMLLAWGGFAAGTVAYGGFALGLVAFGGVAIGVIASGAIAAGLWVPGAANVLWSHFNWETIPNGWRGIGEWLSFNPKSSEERDSFLRLINTLTGITFSFVIVMMVIQGVLMSRERKRLRNIDPSVVD